MASTLDDNQRHLIAAKRANELRASFKGHGAAYAPVETAPLTDIERLRFDALAAQINADMDAANGLMARGEKITYRAGGRTITLERMAHGAGEYRVEVEDAATLGPIRAHDECETFAASDEDGARFYARTLARRAQARARANTPAEA